MGTESVIYLDNDEAPAIIRRKVPPNTTEGDGEGERSTKTVSKNKLPATTVSWKSVKFSDNLRED